MIALEIILLTFIVIAIIGGAILLSTKKGDADHAVAAAHRQVAFARPVIAHLQEAIRHDERARAALLEEQSKMATAARRGMEREVERGNRPLTVREIAEYAKQLPPAEQALSGGNHTYVLNARVGNPPPWSEAEILDRQTLFRRLYFRKEYLRIKQDSRASEQQDSTTPYYRPMDARDYRQQSVWVYDGVVILTPLTIAEEYSERQRPWDLGADVRPHLERRLGAPLPESDREIEEMFFIGRQQMQMRKVGSWS